MLADKEFAQFSQVTFDLSVSLPDLSASGGGAPETPPNPSRSHRALTANRLVPGNWTGLPRSI